MEFNSTPNRTDSENEYGGFQAITDVPFLSIGFLSVLTNVFVIRIILSRRILRTTSNMILVSLGVSDLLTGLVAVPLHVTCSVLVHDGVCITTAIFTKFISISTIMHISIITIDWHIFIAHALRYYEIVRKRYVLMVVVSVWIVNFGLALVRLAWAVDINVTDEHAVHSQETRYNLFCLGLFCLLLVINVALDSHMLVILSRQVSKIIKYNLTRDCWNHENRIRANKRRAVVMCVTMLAINVILWLPYFSYDLWQEHGGLPVEVEYVILSVRSLSSLLNPIIYSVGQRGLRKVIQDKLRFLFPCKHQRECKNEEIPLNE